MITEQDLREAIAECQGQRNPDANTCIKLAAFLTIQREMYPQSTEEQEPQGYSYAAEPKEETAEKTVNYDSGTDFSIAVNGRNAEEMWAIIDELMEILRVTNKRLYNGVLRKIE